MKTNKKTFRKIAGAATAAVLASCAMIPFSVTKVSAASITINNSQSGHTYEAYQIFTGTLSGTGDAAKLSDIKWGADISNETSVLNAVKALAGYSSCLSAADVAEVLASKSTDADAVNLFMKTVAAYLDSSPTGTSGTHSGTGYTISGLADGYYLVKDKDSALSETSYDAYTNYIVEVLGDKTDIGIKSALPKIQKEVQDINDSKESDLSGLQDSADYDIGDLVPFTITGTLPSNYSTYSSYKYEIHDTLSKGLSYDEAKAALKVEVGGVDVTGSCTVTPSANGDETNLTITINDIKTANGLATSASEVVVTYNAVLDTDAVIGSAGNSNTVYLKYSNNPYKASDMGQTPTDLVRVFTYKAVINKTDGSNALKGAAFTLYKHDGSDWKSVKSISSGETTTFEFIGLDDGKYKLVEDAAPQGYNKLSEDIYFEITASHDDDSDDPQLQSVTLTQTKEDGTIVDPSKFTQSDGTFTAEVENKAGSTLPSTGGIGTTPFYVGGGILVAAAGIYIIVKKRMNNNDEK